MKNLKKFRLEKKLSQQQVAQAVNISQSNYSKYEKGVIEPNFVVLKSLADFFKTSVDFLLDRKPQYFIDLSGLSGSQKNLFEAIKNLDYINCIKAEAYIVGLLESQNKLSQEEIKQGKKNNI